ncbi:MAG: DAK2 domain-containing protein [Lachnospiraceae bacterium]|jgi:dihydroxyacetone kinase-like protein|nr:DAK2 domain-containing protein [Lachnospiraceae bacterium]
MKIMTAAQLPDMLGVIAKEMAGHEEELCAMDAKMGDGDLGLTMKKGFGALPEVAASLDHKDLGKDLMTCGMRMSSAIPSTMGFLMGSGFMSGGRAIAGATEMTGENYAKFLRGFANGIIHRGKCHPGDRTILDALDAAAAAAEKAIKDYPAAGFDETAAAAADGAVAGADATIHMKPKFGKAAVHEQQADGTRDQGAVAGMYMVQAISDFASQS